MSQTNPSPPDAFHEDRRVEFGPGGLTALQHIAALPRWPDNASQSQRLSLLLAEAAIRDELMAYAYAYDNQDLDSVLRYFSEDCVIDNPRGRVVGVDAIRANYRVLFGYWKVTRQIWTNVTVRVLDTAATQAYAVAYHHAVLLSDDRKLAGSGTDVRRLRKLGDRWVITQRWITDDVDYTIDVFHGAVEDPGKVDELRRELDPR
jgi:ketosteroid isomerase-like protein